MQQTKIQLIVKLRADFDRLEQNPDIETSEELRLCTQIGDLLIKLEKTMFTAITDKLAKELKK